MTKEETREKIILAAEKLFSENGYDGVSTKTIANEARITEMTLFNHFHTKEELYHSIIIENYLSTEITSIFSKLSFNDFEKDLIVISDKIIDSFFKNKEIIQMRLKEKNSFHNDEIFKVENDSVFIQLVPIFNIYYEKKAIRLTGEKAATQFITMLKGICIISLIEQRDLDYFYAIAKEFVIIFCSGVQI